MATGIKVEDIMKRAVITAKPTDTIMKAASIMAKTSVGGLVVTEGKKIKGIVTEGDIIKELAENREGFAEEEIKEIMKSPVETINRETDLEEALVKMRDLNIERLPIAEKGKLKGIVTERDLTKVEPALIDMAREKNALDAMSSLNEEVRGVSGICEECQQVSEDLRMYEGKLLCEDCRV